MTAPQNQDTRNPTLSVCIPNFNHGHFLGEALAAILAQSWRPMEILVLDDASTDDSISVVEAFMAKEPRLRLIKHAENQGLLPTVNRLLRAARGEYVYFPGADDRICPSFFDNSMSLLSANPRAALSSAMSFDMSPEGTIQGVHSSPIPSDSPIYIAPDQVLRRLRRIGTWFLGHTVIYRRDALLELGGFPSELRGLSDTFCATIMAARYGSCFIPQPLVARRRLPDSYSMQHMQNPEIFLSMLDAFRTLLERRYAGILPSRYIEQWDRELRIGRILGILAGPPVPPDELGVLLTKLDPAGSAFVGTVAARGGNRFPAMIKLALFLRYRPWALLRRRLRRVVTRSRPPSS